MKNYKNPNLPIEERIEDLLNQMTLEEKLRQIDQYSGSDILTKDMKIVWDNVKEVINTKGIGSLQNRNSNAVINNELQRYAIENTRLGIPILFSEEALHGLHKPGCTIYPQQITLASSWSPELAEKVGHGIARETRSFGMHEVWCPVIDLVRDPRWGRVEETYGEDTYLSSRLAASMVKGLQGNDVSQPDRVVSEPKHFAGYGVPTGGLNCAPAIIGRHELFAYYLPVFEAAFVEGGAFNTMCSYSSIDGIPCVSDHELMTEVLRDQWKIPGFVRSDMCAISMLNEGHNTASTKEDAIRQALEAGVDMQLYDYSHDIYQNSIMNMINNGTISLEVLDTAVSRVLRVKFLLGLFENPYTDDTLSHKVVRCDEHQAMALEVARKGICLLKNEGELLPLRKNLKSIAVIGPSAAEARLGDYCVEPEGFKAISILDGIKDMVSPDTEIHYAKGCSILDSDIMVIPSKWLRTSTGERGLNGEYFNNANMSGTPVFTTVDSEINFNWIYSKPSENVDANLFSVKWTGKLVPDKDITGYIGTSSMDSMRLWIDGELIIDGWGFDKDATAMKSFSFVANKEYNLLIEYCKDERGVRVIFGWSYGNDDIKKAIEAASKAEVAIVALGDSEETSGENLDRADLKLPGRQLELVKAIYNTGTPIILVLQNGRPLSITWESEHIPAIVEAWFPGEKGGKAIAEILFGDVNPSGKLPISFPKSVGQLPVYYSRKIAGGLRYVEMDRKALYPFGYGLSYTKFKYSNLQITQDEAKDSYATVQFDVTNIGERAGEEIAQLYIRDCFTSVVKQYMELKGFNRIHLNPGETKTLIFELGHDELKLLNLKYEWVVEAGDFEVMVGPDSENIKLTGGFNVK